MARGKKMRFGRINIRPVKLSDMKDAPYNPRVITEEAREGLSGCMDEFGVVQPIVWNERTGHVVGGHQRKDKLEREGVEITDAVVVDLSLEREKALNIALNNEHIQGKWEYQDLSVLLKSMPEEIRDLTFLPAFEIQPLLEGEWKPPEIDEFEASKEKKKIQCPKCGHEFEN